MSLRKSLNVTTGRCLDLNFLKMLRSCGFDGVDLNFSSDFFRDEQLETIVGNLKEAGLVCTQVHLPTYGLFADSGEDDPDLEKKIEFALSVMPSLGAKWGAIHARRGGIRLQHGTCNAGQYPLAEAAPQHCTALRRWDCGGKLTNFPGSSGCPVLFLEN